MQAFAEQVVQAVKFPPHGVRGLAGDRWCNYNMAGNLAECVEKANSRSVVGVMIEDYTVSNDEIDRMCELEHLDFISLGPTDISATMGKRTLRRRYCRFN